MDEPWNIMLNEGQAQNAVFYTIPFIRNVQKTQIYETENRLVILLGNQEKGVTANGYEISLGVIKCSEVG